MKHFDLFSGYGGFSLALQRVYANNNVGRITSSSDTESRRDMSLSNNSDGDGGWSDTNTIGFSEIDKYASAVLKYHWPNTKNYGDITKINWAEVPDFDLLTGGSPCQDLSIAGKRAGLEGARSGLFYEYMRAVKEKRPKYFIWENVKGALSSNKGFDFAAVLNEMAEAGYSLWWQVLNAKDFGVPQNRERIFVVGFRDGSPREVFFESRANGKNLSEITQGVSDAQRIYNTDGLAKSQKALGGGQGAKTGLYAVGRRNGVGNELDNANTFLARDYKGIGNQPTNAVVVPVLTPDRLEKRQNGRRFKEDGEPSFTLTSQDKHGVYLPPRIRRLTPTECERLMGLPDGWTAKGVIDRGVMGGVNVLESVGISDSQRYKLCGNGVVVNVVEEIIKNLITI